MASWSLYRFTTPAGVESLAVLEQLTSGAEWYTEAGEPFTVPVPASNVIVTGDLPRPVWGRNDPAPVAQVTGTRITKLAFRNRFTQAEKVMLEIAALDNPAASMSARQQAAALRASQLDVAAATFIDLQRADTRAGVLMLEAAGLLAAGRSAVILDTPPTAIELWVE